MYCSNCGKQIEEGMKFCPSCGNQVEILKELENGGESQKSELNISTSDLDKVNDNKNKLNRNKRPIYKKKRFWILVFILISILGGAIGIDDSETRPSDDENKNNESEVEYKEILGEDFSLKDISEDMIGSSFDFAGTYWSIRESGEYIITYKENFKEGNETVVNFFVSDNTANNDLDVLYDFSYEDKIQVHIGGTLKKIEIDEDGRAFYYFSAEKFRMDKPSDESTNTDKEVVNGLTYDFATDVEKGLLYSDMKGVIVDVNGNVIDEYAYVTVIDRGAISNGEHIMEGYFVDENSKIYFEIPEEVDYGEQISTDGIIPLSGEYRNENSPFVFTVSDEYYSYEDQEAFVYVTFYCHRDGDDYQQEYTGMINLFNPGNMTVMTGVQSAAYIEYDCEYGELFGTGVSSIVNDYIERHKAYWFHTIDDEYYEDNEVSRYYLVE